MNRTLPIEDGPPAVRHRIRGELRADLPVGGVEILSHRHVRLSEWSLVDATASYWRLYWGTSGSARVLFDGRSHEQVVDAGNRGFSAFETNPNHHRKPRELCGVLRERVVHCTFLGENGGQYQ